MDLYPCVGLRTVGERVSVNFGQNPFVFDIVQYIKVNHINKQDEHLHVTDEMT